MTSTLATYLQISNNADRYTKITSSQPIVKAQTAYYQQNIGNVKTPRDLVNNYRLFSYVMNAYGLGDMMYARSLVQKVLEQGTASRKGLAYTLNNPNLLALAKTFNFQANGAATTTSDAVKTGVVTKFIQQSMESEQSQSNPGAGLALYFQNHAAGINNAYDILADRKLLTVVQTVLGLSPYTSYQPVDTQAKHIAAGLRSSGFVNGDFQDPAKVQKFLKRFAAMYDATNMGAYSQNSPAPNALGSLSVTSFSSSLLASMQGLKLGGF